MLETCTKLQKNTTKYYAKYLNMQSVKEGTHHRKWMNIH